MIIYGLNQQFYFNTMEPVQRGHVLKFIAEGRTFNPHVGVRTFPRQTFGVSDQSPDQFKHKHTLSGQHSYIYRHQAKPQFQHHSQRHFFDVHRCEPLGNATEIPQYLAKNKVAFHRKKGRLSEFMDKNGWMSPVTPIMGFQRGQNARTLCNRDRQQRINSLKPHLNYQNPTARKSKINPQYHNTISVVMSEKLRIRKKRQDLNQRQGLVSARTIERDADPLLIGNVEERMAKTNLDFYSTSSTFCQRTGPHQPSNKINFSKQLPSRGSSQLERQSKSPSRHTRSPQPRTSLSPGKKTHLSSRKEKIDPKNLQSQDLNLQDWYRKTCSSKWNYRPKKLDSEQRQQERQKMLMSTNF